MDPLTRKRLAKVDDCQNWTPAEMMASFLDEIERGEINPQDAVVVFTHQMKDGTHRIRTWRSKVNRREEIGLLALAQHCAHCEMFD